MAFSVARTSSSASATADFEPISSNSLGRVARHEGVQRASEQQQRDHDEEDADPRTTGPAG